MKLSQPPVHLPPPARGVIALLIFILLSLAVLVYSSSLGYVRSSSKELIPGSPRIRISYFPEEKGADLTLSQVVELDRAGRFEELSASHRFFMDQGRFGGTRWFRIDISNPESSPHRAVLDLIWRLYDRAELYQQRANGKWEVTYTGGIAPEPTAKRSGRWAAFELMIPADGKLTVFLKTQDRYRVPTKFSFWPDRNDFVLREHFLVGIHFAYLCLWIGMLAYGVFLYALLREPAQWHFLLFAIFMGFFHILSSGLGALRFPGEFWTFSELFCAICAWLALYHLALFARYFLNTASKDPPLDVWLQRLQKLQIAAVIILPLGLWPRIGMFYLQGFLLMALIVIFTLLWAGLRRLRAGSSEAVFILLGLSPYLLSLLLWISKAPEFFVRNDEQRLLGLLANALILIFLSFASAHRHRQALIDHSKLQIQYAKSLEHEVLDRTRVLQEMSDQLTLALAERNRVMTIIGHDLRAPASELLGLTRLLADETTSFSPEKLTSLANKIGNSCDLQLELLNNLLTWGNSQAGNGISQTRAELSVKTEVDSAWRLLHGMACAKQVAFHNTAPEGLKLHSDHRIIQTILRNLLVNAIKFTRSGGWIKVHACSFQNGSVEIRIEDNGIGISTDRLNTLFTGAVQSTPGTNVERGTGIGLNLARDLARTLGGDIRIESVENTGTIVFLTLP